MLLLEAGADPSKPEVLASDGQVPPNDCGGKFLGNVQARGYHHLFSTLPGRFKQSPTHIATQQGDLAKIKVLAEHEEVGLAQHKDTKGRTPVALCVEDTVKTAVAELVGPAVVATPIPGNKVAQNGDCPGRQWRCFSPLQFPLCLCCARGLVQVRRHLPELTHITLLTKE